MAILCYLIVIGKLCLQLEVHDQANDDDDDDDVKNSMKSKLCEAVENFEGHVADNGIKKWPTEVTTFS